MFGIFIQHIAEKRSHAVKAIFKDVKLYAILAVTLLQLYYTKFIGGIAIVSYTHLAFYRHIASLNEKTGTKARVGLLQFYYNDINGK